MRLGRRRVAVLAAGTLAVAGMGAGAVAATGGSSDAASDLAEAINERAGTSITADQVEGALRDVLEERLDEAVAAGRITRDQADEILERAGDGPGLGPALGLGPGPGPGDHGPGPGPRGAVMEKAAAALKLSEDELRERLRSGTSLAEVAEAQGVPRATLVAAIAAALRAEGVPAERATEMAGHIADREPGPGRHHRWLPRPTSP